jgi:rod shape-determining protein MreC
MPSFLSKRKNFVVLVSLLFFQMILISIQVPLGEEDILLERIFFTVFAPVQHGVVAFFRGVGDIWDNYVGLRDTRKRYRRVSEENFFLRHENILLKHILNSLRDEADLKELYRTLSDKVIGARVIGMDAGNPYRSVTINRGRRDGLKVDMVVLDAYGNLVGRVIGPVEIQQARVQLITDPESGVSVKAGDDGSPTVLKGMGDGLCELSYSLTTIDDPQPGDMLLSTGFDHIYPPGLKVGIVLTVDRKPELFKDVRVHPFFELRHLDKLAVITVPPDYFIDGLR